MHVARRATSYHVAESSAMPPPFQIEVQPEREAVRVRPVGEIDIATAGRMRAQIDELVDTGFTRVILDLRGVTFLDSTGVHVVVDADAGARANGWALVIVEAPHRVQRTFELAGLSDRLPFVGTGPQADGQK
jgi:anti-anti-sigma factor